MCWLKHIFRYTKHLNLLRYSQNASYINLSKLVGCVSPIFTFEEGRKSLENWTETGDAFTNQPTYGDNPIIRQPRQTSNHRGVYWIGSYENRSTPEDEAGATQGDGPKGSLTSPEFLVSEAVVSFLIGGGCKNTTSHERVELLVNDTVVREYLTKSCSERMRRQSWTVSEFMNKTARLRLVDDSIDSWGHINFDDFFTHRSHCRGACGGKFIQ